MRVFIGLFFIFEFICIICWMNRIEDQNAAIARALQTVAETEEVGTATINELSQNREKIESTQGKVTYPIIA